MEENFIYKKSFDLAAEIYRSMDGYDKTFLNSGVAVFPLLQSSAKIALNIKKAVYEENTEAFIVKMKTALENARETDYWIDLLFESQVLWEEKEWKIAISEIIETLETIVENAEKIEITI